MNYTFHLCRCDPRFEYPQAWYLELPPNDLELITKIHQCISRMHFFRSVNDPHLTPKNDDIIPLCSNPIVLSARWLEARINDSLAGRTFIINMCGGGFYLDDSAVVVKTVYKETLEWDAVVDDEIITIRRWDGAPHWYLSSNKNRIFDINKYVRIEDAKRIALVYVDKDSIEIKD